MEGCKRYFLNDSEKQFYMNCAISAMQGIQENNLKIGSVVAEICLKETAKLAFDMADAMLNEFHNRTLKN